jgi:SPP1 gp7 family putative phage head morphogenesis protein
MLIARTETAKLNASIARDSMQASGATGYIWSTADDERVREGHSVLDGEPFTWDNPPVTDERTGARNHPGEDFQCRCVSLPLYDALPDEADLDAEIADIFANG